MSLKKFEDVREDNYRFSKIIKSLYCSKEILKISKTFFLPNKGGTSSIRAQAISTKKLNFPIFISNFEYIKGTLPLTPPICLILFSSATKPTNFPRDRGINVTSAP